MADLKEAGSERLTISLDKNEGIADAMAVAKTMEALLAIIQETHVQMDETEKMLVKLRPFEKGSFQIPLELIVIGTSLALLSEHPLIQQTISFIRQFVEIKLHLKGKPLPTELPDGQLVIKDSVVENSVINLVVNSKVSRAFDSAVSEILRDDSVQSVTITRGKRGDVDTVVKITRDELPYLQKPGEADESDDKRKTTFRDDVVVIVHTPVLHGNAKWKVLLDDHVIEVSIEDEAYLDQVHRSKITFAAGDRMQVNLKVIHKYDFKMATYLPDKYVVTKVVGKWQPSLQKTLFDEMDGGASEQSKKRRKRKP